MKGLGDGRTYVRECRQESRQLWRFRKTRGQEMCYLGRKVLLLYSLIFSYKRRLIGLCSIYVKGKCKMSRQF